MKATLPAEFMLRRIIRNATCLLPLLLLLPGNRLHATDEFAPGTVGHWEGNARIIVTWAQQTNLRVALDIDADGRVTGRIGDATLTDGQLKKNRGWIEQNLNVKTDYIIVGKLQGAIVAREGITRSRVKIPLNLSGGTLRGGLHTSGSKFGGKEQMILSAANLTLHRCGNETKPSRNQRAK